MDATKTKTESPQRTRSTSTSKASTGKKASTTRSAAPKTAGKKNQSATPQEKSRISSEARNPQKPSSLPHFSKAFRSGPITKVGAGAADTTNAPAQSSNKVSSKDSPRKPQAEVAGSNPSPRNSDQPFNTVAQTVNQGRVIAGQSQRSIQESDLKRQARLPEGQPRTPSELNKLSRDPRVVQSVRGVGTVAAPLTGLAAVNNARDAIQSFREGNTKQGLLDSAQALGNGAHSIHGFTQAADFGVRAAPNGIKPVNPPVPASPQAGGPVGIKENLARFAGTKSDGLLSRVAQGAGKAAPALGGIAQGANAIFGKEGIREKGLNLSNGYDLASGSAKLAGATLIATGIGAPLGAGLIAVSTAGDLAKAAYQNNFLGTKTAADFVGDKVSQGYQALKDTVPQAAKTAASAALNAIPGIGPLARWAFGS